MIRRSRLVAGRPWAATRVRREDTRPTLCQLTQSSSVVPQTNYYSWSGNQVGRAHGGQSVVPSFSHFPRQHLGRSFVQQRFFSDNVDGEDPNDMSSEKFKVTTGGEGGSTDLGVPGAQKGGKKLAIVYTCTVCNTRAAKQFTEQAYQHGVVIIQCPGCDNRHLIADNLGFFNDEDEGGWNIEKAMSNLGENVKVVNDDNVLELSIDDVYGEGAVAKAVQK